MKNNEEIPTRMNRHTQSTEVPEVTKKPGRSHRVLSFFMGLIFILALIVRFTVLNGSFMATAVQTPTVINQVHTRISTQLQEKNLPTGLVTDNLVKVVLKTGVKQTYAGQTLNLNQPEVQQAVTDSVKQQATGLGLGDTGIESAASNAVAGEMLTAVTANYQDTTLTYFAEHVLSYQLWTFIVILVSGVLWILLMIHNHRVRRNRRNA